MGGDDSFASRLVEGGVSYWNLIQSSELVMLGGWGVDDAAFWCVVARRRLALLRCCGAADWLVRKVRSVDPTIVGASHGLETMSTGRRVRTGLDKRTPPHNNLLRPHILIT